MSAWCCDHEDALVEAARTHDLARLESAIIDAIFICDSLNEPEILRVILAAIGVESHGITHALALFEQNMDFEEGLAPDIHRILTLYRTYVMLIS